MLEDDDYWNESDVGRTVKLDFFNANSFEEQEDPDPYLTTEVEPEIGAELITLNKFGNSNQSASAVALSSSNVSSTVPAVSVGERMTVQQRLQTAQSTMYHSSQAQSSTRPLSANVTPSRKQQARLTVPKSLAAEYTFAVRKAVKEKSGDQKALELERCERLLQMYVRAYIAANPLPKVTFSPDEVIAKLTTGGKRNEEAVLEVFRSEKQKRVLLERACQSLNGACITKVALFLYRSLSEDVFQEIITPHQDAVRHLVSYFSSMADYTNLEKLYKALGRHRDMFYLLLRKANNEPVAETKLWALQTIKHRICSKDVEPRLKIAGVSPSELEMLSEQISLLECQLRIQQVNEVMLKKKTNQILLAQPPLKPITSLSLVSTVEHCELYHPNSSSTTGTSAVKQGSAATGSGNEGVVDSAMYKVKFKLTDIEYQWPLVRVYASRRQWDRLDQLMVQKGFLSSAASSIMGGVGMGSNSSSSSSGSSLAKGSQCAIGFDNMAQILTDNNAPSDIVSKYLMGIKDQHARLQQAGVLDCKLAVVMTHIENKDKSSLESIAARLAPGSKEMRECIRVLEDRSIKWKR